MAAHLLLTLDVGNTNVGVGVFSGRRLVRVLSWPTRPRASRSALERTLAASLRREGLRGPWAGAAFASVVPSLDRPLRAAVRAVCGTKVLQVTALTPLPVRNAYGAPRTVGADRLVAAVAAVAEFGAPVIVVDFGTAITVDAVSRRREYLGGAILPGLELAADALAARTALLPRLDLSGAPRRRTAALGRTTRDSLEAGLRLGAAGAVRALIAGLRRRVGAAAPVVATGGGARWVRSLCPEIRFVRPHLMHAGLHEAWRSSRQGRVSVRRERSTR